MALVYLLGFLIAAATIGRAILHLLQTAPEDRTERIAVSAALGLGVMGYLVLAVGLAGMLRPGVLLDTVVVVTLVCLPGLRLLARDLRTPRVAPMPNDISAGEAPADRVEGESRLLRRSVLAVLLFLGAIALVNCFVPPGAHEWDAQAYHLAAPKVYLQHHRIVFLPTDHHSNFPFLVEMLFTLGLAFGGYALANLFHFAFAALSVAALVGIGRRHFSRNSGWIAALAFACAPIVVWEAGAAYIEHGMALYVLLSVGAALEYRRSGEARWLGLAGILMGFALGTKALALVPAFALPILLLVSRVRFKELRWYLAAALALGCPFYTKSWVVTGDPVYPFGYRIFHGRYWNEDLATTYSGTQKAFGLQRTILTAGDDWRNVQPPAEPRSVVDRLRNAMVAPFALIAVPRVFYDYIDPGMFTQLGFLFLALPALLLAAPAATSRPDGRAIGLTAGVALVWYLAWSQTMQYVRYLVPLLPLVFLLGGEGTVRAGGAWRSIGALAAIVIGLQVLLTGQYYAGRTPQQFAIATDPVARESFLTKTVNHYQAMQWLNRNAPPNAGVVLFEETRGFYLDRPYLWGNYYHSLFIPYATFATGKEMADWFLSHGFRYALVNLQFSQMAFSSPENHQKLLQAVREHSEAGLMLEWYGPNAAGGERWRSLLGEAMREGAAVVVDPATTRGAVVLEWRSSKPGLAGDAMETTSGGGQR